MSTDNTNLAGRLSPTKEKQFFVTFPAALVAGAVLLLVSVPSLVALAPGGFIVALFGVMVFCLAFERREVTIMPPPLPDGPAGHKHATELLANSKSAFERAHAFLGTVFGTFGAIPVLLFRALINMHVLRVHRGNNVSNLLAKSRLDSRIRRIPWRVSRTLCAKSEGMLALLTCSTRMSASYPAKD